MCLHTVLGSIFLHTEDCPVEETPSKPTTFSIILSTYHSLECSLSCSRIKPSLQLLLFPGLMQQKGYNENDFRPFVATKPEKPSVHIPDSAGLEVSAL